MSVATAVVENANVGTIRTALDVAAEYSSATNLDCGHHPALGDINMVGVGGAPRLTMAAKNIRQL
jgi:hypothetical protein